MAHTYSQEELIVEALGKEDLKRLLDDHQKLLILYGFANAVSTLFDDELLLNEAMNVIFGLVKAERGAIFLVDPKTGRLVHGVSRSRQTKDKNPGHLFVNTVMELALQGGKAVLTSDAAMDSRFKASRSVQSQHIRSCLCVPLTSQHRTLGVIYADSRSEAGNFSKEELTLVSGIANQTAVALENIESVHRLKEERKRVEGILRTLPIAILSIDEKGVISFVNPQAEKLFGISCQQCLSRPYLSFLESHHFESLSTRITHAFRDKKEIVLEEVTCGTPEKRILLQVNIVPLREGVVEKGVLVALDDVTEKKTLEQEIANAEKLSAIGEMTAGLVHEIINPLSIISGRAQLLIFEKEKEPEVVKTARIIREQVDRASAITEKLLSFARQRPSQLRAISLHELLDSFLETMEEQFASQKIRVTKTFVKDPLLFMGDAEQLEEVFVNLARNAIQAMPEGGQFTVATQKEADHMEVSFADTGCGIPAENLSKIFIPFFTTKSRGTGLGLSIVHGIVKNHGGTLKVQSQTGKGTMFILSFPLKKEDSA